MHIHGGSKLGRSALLVLLALIGALALPVSPANATAPCPTPALDIVSPSCFEGGDGNLIVDAPGGDEPRIDWVTLAPTIGGIDGTGPTDSAFEGGDKEHDPGTWTFIQGSQPGKVDVVAFAARTDPVSGNVFFYGAFQRATNDGDSFLSFELNQIPGTFDNDNNPDTPEIPIRSEGDLMITYDGGGTNVRVGACIWHGDRFGESSTAVDAADYGWYTLPGFGQPGSIKPKGGGQDSGECTEISGTDPATRQALGALPEIGDLENDGILTGFSNPIPEGTFGEVVVNVSAIFAALPNPNPCIDFGSAWLHTRSASAISNQMQDATSPVAIIGATTCSLEVDKTVAVNDGPFNQGLPTDPSYANNGDTLNYRLAVTNDGLVPVIIDEVLDAECDAAPVLLSTSDGDGADDTPGTFDPGDTWTYSCSHVLAADDPEPFVNEVIVNGHVGDTPRKDLTDSDTAVTARYGRLVIEKNQTDGSDAQDFSFDASAALGGASNLLISESDPGFVFPNLIPNTGPNSGTNVYSVSEDDPGSLGYRFTGVDCDDSDSTQDSQTPTATATISAGETVTCTFANQRLGTITVNKVTVPAGDSGSFGLQIDGTTEATGGNGTTTGAHSLPAGQHSVGEVGANGTDLGAYNASINCGEDGSTSGSGPLNVDLSDGEDIVCTITNVRKPRVIVRKLTVPASDPQSTDHQFAFTSTLPGGDFTLGHDQTEDQLVDPGAYTATEADPSAKSYKLDTVICVEAGGDSNSSGNAGTRTATIDADPGETITCTFTNRLISAELVVLKVGDVFAYHGDQVTYTFSVSPRGSSAISNVAVTDNRCSPVTGPAQKLNDNGNATLDVVGADGVNPETWVYTCTKTISAAHVAGEEDPIVNTATATGTDELGRPVSATDDHTTDILHNAIDIEKTGPAQATAGEGITYTLQVTNPGEQPFPAALVVVTDALCEAPPALQSTNGDPTPAFLNVGDRWTYTCVVRTAAGQTLVDNLAQVRGTDVNGRPAGDESRAQTVLAQQVVAPAIAGSARLRGPAGCPTTRYATFRVTGRNIASVRFVLDGRTIATVRRANSRGEYRARRTLRALRYGTHRVTAVVTFVTGATPQTRTLRMSFTRCRPRAKPTFTG